MKQLHDADDGEIEPIVGHEGCYDDNYGRCMKCGLEGELIVEDTDEITGRSFRYHSTHYITPRTITASPPPIGPC